MSLAELAEYAEFLILNVRQDLQDSLDLTGMKVLFQRCMGRNIEIKTSELVFIHDDASS